jgi:hypothetical protein
MQWVHGVLGLVVLWFVVEYPEVDEEKLWRNCEAV